MGKNRDLFTFKPSNRIIFFQLQYMHQYTAVDLQDTIVALSTPQGVGAIGIIRLSGPNAIHICNAVFHNKNLLKQASHTIHFGTIRDEGKIIDEVLVSVFKAPNSYTSDDLVEVSCHGSPFILQSVIRLFLKKGARLAKAGEFTMRAFLNGKMDLSQAEAVADLIASETASAHQIAMQQMRGGFSKQIEELRQKLIDFASLIELELDFSEEDVEFANRQELVSLVKEIRTLLSQLMQSFKLGNAIKNGVSTVIAGRPNAGKSTLLNALLNEDRAIVSEIAGTTRDTIEEVVNIDGIPFRLIDTAGIRAAQDTIEAIGVEKTMEKLRQSAIAVFLFDVEEVSLEEVQADLENFKVKEVPFLLVGNQIDKSEKDYKTAFAPLGEVLFISSKDQTNIDVLKQALKGMVLDQEVNTSDTIVSNIRHFEALQQADQALNDVLNGIEMQLSGELLALDIRQSLHYLGSITGQVTTDDLLGNIFGRFCIGK